MNTLAFDSLLYFKDESQLDYQFLLLHLYSFLDAWEWKGWSHLVYILFKKSNYTVKIIIL